MDIRSSHGQRTQERSVRFRKKEGRGEKRLFSRFRRDNSAEQETPEAPTSVVEPPEPAPVAILPVKEEPVPAPAVEAQAPPAVRTEAPSPVVAEVQPAVAAEAAPEKPKLGIFARLKSGLQKTRDSLKGKLGNLFLITRKIDEDLLEELEEMLIGSDIGVQTTMEIIENVRRQVSRDVLKNGQELKAAIQTELLSILNGIPSKGFDFTKKPLILLVVGVNGVGKTTTIGKISRLFSSQGKSVVMCAADTFRAAAVEQLQIWSQRAGVDIVAKVGSNDPASVVFDAIERCRETQADVLIIDTAGRLHNNPNLMNELSKIYRIIGRSYEDAPHHVMLILDAVTGQNGLQQARQFVAKVGVTDLVITKLDGTAKGGIAVAIAKELNLPIQFIGVGEQMEDLLPFDSGNFVKSLFED